MKTSFALQAPTVSEGQRVKKFLIQGIIFLTSEKFRIFVGVIAALICYAGVLMDDMHVIGYGALTFIAGFTPRAIRDTARETRQDRIGLNNVNL